MRNFFVKQLALGAADEGPVHALSDPALGVLTWDALCQWWTARLAWPPTGQDITVVLPGNRARPDPRAKALLLDLLAQSDLILDVARPSLRRWRASLRRSPLADPFSVLVVYEIWVETCADVLTWTLCVDSPEGGGHDIELSFRGWQVTHMHVDS